MGYCGEYCGACGIYQGKMREAVQNLQQIIQAYRFDKIPEKLSQWDPAFQHYKQFEEVLNSFGRMFQECPGCPQNGGDPECPARKCCTARNLKACYECADLEGCKKLPPDSRKDSLTIRTKGTEAWLKEMERKVAEGYCYLDEKTEPRKNQPHLN